MALDRRLRDELQREAAKIAPDAGRGLLAVEARARRRATAGLGSLLVAAAAVVLIVVGVQALQSTSPDTGPGGSVPPTVLPYPSSGTAEIAGTYHATLELTDGGAEFADVAGEWTMDLRPDGVMLMAPPATFREGSAPQSGVAYSIDGERFRSNLFQQLCNSIGVYGWVMDGGMLTLTSVEDDCALRRAVLASTPWTRR
jgi:hypothetical protein